MKRHEIWREQCDAARRIEDEFGVPNALSYLVGEKFLNFLEVADWAVLHGHEIEGRICFHRGDDSAFRAVTKGR